MPSMPDTLHIKTGVGRRYKNEFYHTKDIFGSNRGMQCQIRAEHTLTNGSLIE